MSGTLLQACLNGARKASEHPGLSPSPAAMVSEATGAVRAGASSLHIHPKNERGEDSLDPIHVAAWVATLREACPGVAIGVTTGEWSEPDVAKRLERIAGWSVLPDFASVNWHESGSAEVARLLIDRKIDVEAGLWNTEGAHAWASSPLGSSCVRALIEVPDLPAERAESLADELIGIVRDADSAIPILLHGEESSAWRMLDSAVRRGVHSRIGLEDTLRLPDGSVAPGNANLVASAVRKMRWASGASP